MAHPDHQRTTIEAVNKPEDYFFALPVLKMIASLDKVVPFYLLRPTAMPHTKQILEFLAQQGMAVTGKRRIVKFEEMAPYIYPVYPDDENTYLWLMATRALLPESYNMGLALLLDPKHEYDEIFDIKMKVRELLGITYYTLLMLDGTRKESDLHHFHAPDQEELASQFNILLHFSEAVE